MDEVIVETIDTESLINNEEKEVETPNTFDLQEISVDPSTEEIVTTSNEVQEITALAPDAIFSDPVSVQSLQETGSENMQTEQQVENISSEQSTEETTIYNIDDLYTLLNSGSLTVKLQSESETEQLQSESETEQLQNESESELTISDIITQLENNRISESECLQIINENIVKSSENEKTLSVISITILVAILGGLVALGFLKGLR